MQVKQASKIGAKLKSTTTNEYLLQCLQPVPFYVSTFNTYN